MAKLDQTPGKEFRLVSLTSGASSGEALEEKLFNVIRMEGETDQQLLDRAKKQAGVDGSSKSYMYLIPYIQGTWRT